jgi:atypical dual specificity phosphatase
VTDKPTFFTWVRPGKIAASGRPYSKDQVDWLNENGVTAILSLTEEPLPKGWTVGLESKHIPMKDHALAEPADMLRAAEYIASATAGGRAVLVHCLAGKGRTGSVLAAYMMLYEGKTARQAIDELRASRPGSVEFMQEPAVLEFEAEAVRRRSTRAPSRETTARTRP